MKKKDIVSGKVVRLDFPNIGIVETPDGEVRVKNVLPGWEIDVRITKLRKGKAEGMVVGGGLEQPRTDAFCNGSVRDCPHFGICGGCLYGGMSYDEELSIKEGQIERLLAPVIGRERYGEIYKGIIRSPRELEYRNKMEFSFGDEYKDGPLSLGMHKRGAFYDIVPVKDCMIVDEDFRRILSVTLDFFKEKGTPFYNKNTHEGYLRHLLVRKAGITGEILLSLITSTGMNSSSNSQNGENSGDYDSPVKEWCKAIQDIPFKGKLAGVLHTVNDRIGDVIEDQGTRILYGQDYFYERLLSLDFKITPFSFFQTNSLGAEKLYETVRELMPKSGTVYDLYSGTGTIGQIVSPAAENVIGVEIVPEAVKAANENAMANGITNAKFLAGDVFKVLDEIEDKPDMIILDPPREGITPKSLKKILSYRVREIIYVSCKATSLQRDLPVFFDEGYECTFLKLCDMFPRTANIETIVHLRLM